MRSPNPSRRHLLAGLCAGLFSWFLPAKAASAAPAPAPARLPTQEPSPVGLVVCTEYDANGRIISRTYCPASPPGEEFAPYDALTRTTAYIYDGRPS